MDRIVTEYLPRAFAFIYTINSSNAGGVQKDRVSNELRYYYNCNCLKSFLYLVTSLTFMSLDNKKKDKSFVSNISLLLIVLKLITSHLLQYSVYHKNLQVIHCIPLKRSLSHARLI